MLGARLPHRLCGSLFCVPKDEARRKNNLHCSDKPLDNQCAVCELHFESMYILHDYVHVVDGKEVKILYGVPILTSDVVPTILLNAPKYLNTKCPPNRASRKREAAVKLEKRSCKRKRDEGPSGDTTMHDEHVSGTDESPNLDAGNLKHLKTPTAYWSAHKSLSHL